jgi:hypothetical protein
VAKTEEGVKKTWTGVDARARRPSPEQGREVKGGFGGVGIAGNILPRAEFFEAEPRNRGPYFGVDPQANARSDDRGTVRH